MKTRFSTSWVRGALLALPFALTTACAYQRPAEVTAQIAKTESSLQQAEQSGATNDALPELQSARDKFADAQRALEKKNKQGDRQAIQLAQQAQIDAQYAAAKAQTVRQAKAVEQVERGTDAVEREAQRDAGTQPAR
jgi:Domain of unknown function (DUF4398)